MTGLTIKMGNARRTPRRAARKAPMGIALGGSLALLTVLLVGVLLMSGCSSPVDEASALETAGDWEGALEVYEGMLEKDTDDLYALSGAAVALMMLQRYDEAVTYQERVVALDTEDAQTRVELGFNYLNHQDRAEDAVRVLAEAAVLEASAKNLSFLAQAQKAAGDDRAAEESLRRAIVSEPTYVYSYRLLISLLDSQGRDSEAQQVIEEGRSLGLDVRGSS